MFNKKVKSCLMILALSCAITMPLSIVEAGTCCGKAGTHDVYVGVRTCTSGCTVKVNCNSCNNTLSTYTVGALGHDYQHSYFWSMHSPYNYYKCSRCGDIDLRPKY